MFPLSCRPEWQRCSDYVYGGTTRWAELSEGKGSNEQLEILIKELDGAAQAGDDYLPGKGVGNEVPLYLRFDGQVRNKRMSRRDCAMFIRDVWRDKIDFENSVSFHSLLRLVPIKSHIPCLCQPPTLMC